MEAQVLIIVQILLEHVRKNFYKQLTINCAPRMFNFQCCLVQRNEQIDASVLL